MKRRQFIQTAAASVLASSIGITSNGCFKKHRKELIKKIETEIIWHGRTTGKTWFHPRACKLPKDLNPTALMTCQTIGGSDVFSQVHWSVTNDNGKTWTDPKPISALGRKKLSTGIEEGTCDVVPVYHSQTNTVLAIGHNVYYSNNVLTKPTEGRYPVYVIRDSDGNWSDRKKLLWDYPDISGIYTSGCAQRITLENGLIILPLSFGPKERADRGVCSVLCSYESDELKILKTGNVLRLAVKRGLLEPTLTELNGKFFMTIRAEDGFGYVTTSEDGLLWRNQQRWCWENGEPLTMSTTQQRWLTHSNGLFLVYTRKAKHNINVMRWRAPLYVAQVDPEKLCLIRKSEKVVFPLVGDGINNADHVARMGNFHVVNASPTESWITVGETLPHDGWKGNTLLGRIFWAEKNKLAYCT
jgi:hypothetical protein